MSCRALTLTLTRPSLHDPDILRGCFGTIVITSEKVSLPSFRKLACTVPQNRCSRNADRTAREAMNVAVERLSGLQQHTVRHRQLFDIESP